MKSQKTQPSKKGRPILIIIVTALLLTVIAYFYFSKPAKPIKNIRSTQTEEPKFEKEGTLWFIGKERNDTLRQVAIEISDDQNSRTKGLMYRSTMPDTQAMLFIFDKSAKRSFWMKNTPMSLDIMYVNEAKEIVSISRHTAPYSEKSIPSEREALYVVETIAGFSDNYNIEVGDRIAYLKDQ